MSGVATVADLFCGAGGLSLGFHAAGARTVAALDHDERAAETFDLNFRRIQEEPPLVLTGAEADLSEIDLSRPPGGIWPDIVIGGPPCQGFSTIGRAKLASLAEDPGSLDPRNQLYFRFLDAVRSWRPRAVVMENVPGMLSVKGRNVALDVAADMAGCGYRVGYALLNAVWYGVPQFRERLFFIGLRDDLGRIPEAPRPTHRATLPAGYMSPREGITLPLAFVPHFELAVNLRAADRPATTVADALDDLPSITSHLEPDSRHSRGDFRRHLDYRTPPCSLFATLMRTWPDYPTPSGVVDHVVRHTPRDFETFRRMKPGDRYPEALTIARERFRTALEEMKLGGIDVPVTASDAYRELERRFVPPYPETIFVDKWRKFVPDEPSWTVPAHLAKDTYSHIHHDGAQARTISIREAARLQSFPDGHLFTGNMGDCYRQIGNAVPPLLAWAVASTVLRLLGYPERRSPLA